MRSGGDVEGGELEGRSRASKPRALFGRHPDALRVMKTAMSLVPNGPLHRPLHIGYLIVAPPVLLAPIAAVTDLPFRTICEEMGVGITITEFLSAQALDLGARKTVDKVGNTGEHGDGLPKRGNS